MSEEELTSAQLELHEDTIAAATQATRQVVERLLPELAEAAVRAAYTELVTSARRTVGRWPGGEGPVRHGTIRAYRNGCRCEDCKAKKAATGAAERRTPGGTR